MSKVDSFAMQGRGDRPAVSDVDSLAVFFRNREVSGTYMEDAVSGARYSPTRLTFYDGVNGAEAGSLSETSRNPLTKATLPNLGTSPFLVVASARVITTDSRIRIAFGDEGGDSNGNIGLSNYVGLHYLVDDGKGNVDYSTLSLQAVLVKDDEIFVTFKYKGTGNAGSVLSLVKQDGTAITNGATTAGAGAATGDIDLSTSLGNRMKIGGLALQGVAIYTYSSEPSNLDDDLLWMQSLLGKYRTPYPDSIKW